MKLIALQRQEIDSVSCIWELLTPRTAAVSADMKASPAGIRQSRRLGQNTGTKGHSTDVSPSADCLVLKAYRAVGRPGTQRIASLSVQLERVAKRMIAN